MEGDKEGTTELGLFQLRSQLIIPTDHSGLGAEQKPRQREAPGN